MSYRSIVARISHAIRENLPLLAILTSLRQAPDTSNAARMGHRVTLHRIAMAVRAGTYIMRRRSATSSPPDGHCRGAPFVASRGTLGSLPRWTCSNGSKSRSAARRLLPSCVRRVHALLSAHLEAVCRNISPCTIVDISAFRASAFDARRERRVQLAIASRIAPARTRRPDLSVSSGGYCGGGGASLGLTACGASVGVSLRSQSVLISRGRRWYLGIVHSVPLATWRPRRGARVAPSRTSRSVERR